MRDMADFFAALAAFLWAIIGAYYTCRAAWQRVRTLRENRKDKTR